jgi:uncharacterized protein YcbX
MNESAAGIEVGRVVGLWRYPVKSMAAEALAAAEVAWHGVAGDRRWAFVRDGQAESGFPWLTLRERGDLGRYRPAFVDPAQPDRSAVVVHTPHGATLALTDAALAAELHPGGVRLMKCDRGVFDTFPLSLTSTQTLFRLAQMVGSPLDVQRFRPNILVEASDGTEFPEDQWVGRVLRLGTLAMRIDKRDGRCAVITIDPATGGRDPSILRVVASERQGCLGVYGSTVAPGRIAIGDRVFVQP